MWRVLFALPLAVRGLNTCSGSDCPEGIPVHVYWIRHAYSCANLIKAAKAELFNLYRDACTPDSILTDIGMVEAQTLHALAHLPPLDLYATSQCRRAIESGVAIYPAASTITPIPYVNEKRAPIISDRDNQPSTRVEQQTYFCTAIADRCDIRDKFQYASPSGVTRKVNVSGSWMDFQYYQDEDKAMFAEKQGPDQSQFYHHLARTWLPPLRDNQTEFSIGVISHSHTISAFLEESRGSEDKWVSEYFTGENDVWDKSSPKLGNSAVVKDTYILSPDGPTIFRDADVPLVRVYYTEQEPAPADRYCDGAKRCPNNLYQPVCLAYSSRVNSYLTCSPAVRTVLSFWPLTLLALLLFAIS